LLVEGGSSVEVRGLTWRPAARLEPVLSDLALRIAPGERVLVAGPSGAGKSTLLRALAGVLLTADVGDLSGDVRIDGHEPHRVPGRVGLLLQDPSAAVVAERVGRDVAFGLENLQLPRAETWVRVRTALVAVGFPYGEQHPTVALSGGEMQRLALAGALAMEPGLLLLDEPTSMLDPAAAAEVRRAVLDVVSARGSTLVIVEHRLEPWLDEVDRLLVMDATGAIIADGEPRRVLEEHREALLEVGVWLPGVSLPKPLEFPAALVEPATSATVERGQALVSAREVVVRHVGRRAGRRGATTLALDDVSADLVSGRALAVTGPSGAGKSTLVALLAGLARPDSGEVLSAPALATRQGRVPWAWRSPALAARLSWVPQQPEHGIVTGTVLGELLAAARATGRDETWAANRARGLLDLLGLDRLAQTSPYHLSGGEQRRLMLAAALVHGPYAVLLDEPTVGQDRNTWAAVLGACAAARDAGSACALATHDLAAAGALADDRLVLSAGRVA